MSSIPGPRCSKLLPAFMTIPDDFGGFDKDLFCIPAKYRDSVSHVLITHGMIQVCGCGGGN